MRQNEKIVGVMGDKIAKLFFIILFLMVIFNIANNNILSLAFHIYTFQSDRVIMFCYAGK